MDSIGRGSPVARLGRLTLSVQSFDGQINSPNDMVVDTDDLAVEPNDTEKDDVAEINPAALDKGSDQLEVPLASDCRFRPEPWVAAVASSRCDRR